MTNTVTPMAKKTNTNGNDDDGDEEEVTQKVIGPQ